MHPTPMDPPLVLKPAHVFDLFESFPCYLFVKRDKFALTKYNMTHLFHFLIVLAFNLKRKCVLDTTKVKHMNNAQQIIQNNLFISKETPPKNLHHEAPDEALTI